MRRRPAPDPHATEVARRRLEALSRELGLEGTGARARPVDQDLDDDLDTTLSEVPWSPGPGSGRSATWTPLTETTPQSARWDPEPWADERPPQSDVRRPPGRHALPRSSWRDRLADWSADRAAGGSHQFGAAHLAVVALLVAVSLAIGAWHTMRGSVEQAPVAAPTLSDPSGSAADTIGETAETAGPDTGASPAAPAPSTSGATGAGASPGSEVVVDVVGRVRKPGIAVLPAGSRVVDALKAAGGARPGVRTDALNLARPLADGEQIVVGRSAALTAPPAATGTAPSVGSPAGGASPTALVNLNTADQVTLETLPGVGPVTAAAILQWRAEHGGFTAVEELLEVSGIGDATLAEIAPHVTI